MITTTALARWSKRSNRKRAVETAARAAPWLAAIAALAVFAADRAGVAIGAGIGGALALVVVVLAVRRQRSVRHVPATLARTLDRRHHTVDLLQTALAIESGDGPRSLDEIVVARAGQLVPELEPTAVAPLKLRANPLAGISVVAAAALLLLMGADTRDDQPAQDVLGEQARAQASELAKAVDDLAKDSELSPEARAKLHEAKQALDRAAAANTGKAALAAMSEAQRLLDEVAPHLAAPRPEELKNMSAQQLADRLASAAKSGDAQQLAALAKEAMRRAEGSEAAAQELAAALDAASKKAGGADPWTGGGFDNTPAGKRLSTLAGAASQMKSGDMDAAKASLADLTKSAAASGAGKDSRSTRMADARRMLSQLRAEQRDAINGMSSASARMASGSAMQDARAEAARAAARSGSRPGSGMRPGMGMGMGMGSGSGSGSGSGMGKGMGMGMGSGPGSGEGSAGSLSVLAPGGMPGGQQGSTGSHGGTTPSGAEEPETVMAEEVETPPPTALSPEGVIRAIAEHAQGDHRSTQFDAIRDHYEAIAESAIHRDEIPLTRRDFIQRYFEALRTREAP